MRSIFHALVMSFFSLARPGLWGYFLAPLAFACVLFLVLALAALSPLIDWFASNPPFILLASWGIAWLATALAWLAGWTTLFLLSYLSAAMIAAVFLMPWLVPKIARRDYPELAAMGSDPFWPGLLNGVLATVLFSLGWFVSLPFWLMPGLGLVLPLLLMAWFNRRTFAYDALARYATPEESRLLREQEKGGLFGLGLVLAAFAHLPFLGLFMPALASLAYCHYCLAALRRLRGGALVTVVAAGPSAE
ncbi:MAG: EI24 domain-containing protein [Zoogloeaceae bacterium]|jgi:uncharacterized protein involved in cysteine biosynthesis|nr:EI24 domain-containing protein [Zoogloeaceae bacterium]